MAKIKIGELYNKPIVKGDRNLVENHEIYVDDLISESQGGSTTNELKRNDVNFYDYDGTLLYSYTYEEACKLKSLPPAPSHKGLIFQEWNYTLEDIWDQGTETIMVDGDGEYCLKVGTITIENKIYYAYSYDSIDSVDWVYITPKNTVTTEDEMMYADLVDGEWVIYKEDDVIITYPIQGVKLVKGYADVGANYTTDDGKSRFHINNPIIGSEFRVHSDVPVTIDWGDGTIEEAPIKWDGIPHVYNELKEYIITVEMSSSGSLGINIPLYYNFPYELDYSNVFLETNFGNNVTETYVPNNDLYLGNKVSIPTTLTSIEGNVNFRSTKTLIHPRNTKYLTRIYNNSQVQVYSIPNTIPGGEDYNGYSETRIHIDSQRLVIPKKFMTFDRFYTNVGGSLDYLYINCNYFYGLVVGNINTVVTNSFDIGEEFNADVDIDTLIVSPLCVNINGGDFSNAVSVLDLSNCEYVPTFSSYFNYTPHVIIINETLYNIMDVTNSPVLYDNVKCIGTDLAAFSIKTNYNTYDFICKQGMTWEDFLLSPFNCSIHDDNRLIIRNNKLCVEVKYNDGSMHYFELDEDITNYIICKIYDSNETV